MTSQSAAQLVLIAVEHDGDIALVCTANPGHDPFWGLPTAAIAPGESLEVVITRALADLGLSAAGPAADLGEVRHVDDDGYRDDARLALVPVADRATLRVSDDGVLWRTVLGGPPYLGAVDAVLAPAACADARIRAAAIAKLSSKISADHLAIHDGDTDRDPSWWQWLSDGATARQRLAERYAVHPDG